ncbi:MAG TPA: proton-conducting transporter membrane subunit [Polyangiaceae bacterium]|nr:proton-conducting transporter membrane subunit [Polyangiaceae bacterium]
MAAVARVTAPAFTFENLVRVDATTRLFLVVVNPIFLGISSYVWYRVHTTPALRGGMRRFVAWAAVFLASTNALLLANHLLALWMLLELTALAATPLVVGHGHVESRGAALRYLLFSTVGLGLVALGFGCLSRGMVASGQSSTFFVDRLIELRPTANAWSRLGLCLVLLGLGTKLGLAPMYSWLPETYDQAPPAVAAMLGAVQFNAALVVLFRVVQAYRATSPALVASQLLAMGLVSMLVSTVSIIATRNIKRLIAYAAINHAGVIAIGLAVGGSATYGLLLYVLSNAFIKAILFLTTGKIFAHYKTNDTRVISGLIHDLPYSGVFLMVGTIALLGFPPFGSFLGELLILSALVGSGRMLTFAAFCTLITMTFVATGRTVFPMIWGLSKERHEWPRQTLLAGLPKLTFLLALVGLGIYIPPSVNTLLQAVARSLGGP